MTWPDGLPGVLVLPNGRRVRGRALHPRPRFASRPARRRHSSSAASVSAEPAPTLGLYLNGRRPPSTPWPAVWIRWPDFGIPLNWLRAARALHSAYDACETERVEVACGGGRGRTGTALACLVTCSGLSAGESVRVVRAGYDPRAVETPWQRAFVHWFAG